MRIVDGGRSVAPRVFLNWSGWPHARRSPRHDRERSSFDVMKKRGKKEKGEVLKIEHAWAHRSPCHGRFWHCGGVTFVACMGRRVFSLFLRGIVHFYDEDRAGQ